MAEPRQLEVKKRTYLGLLLAVLLIIAIPAGYLLLFAREPLDPVSQSVMLWLTAIIFAGVLLLLFCLLLVTISIMKNRAIPGLGWLTGKTLFLLYPLVVYIGRLLHIAQENIQHSFIAVNNRLLSGRPLRTAAQNILLLVPHCLQHAGCDFNIIRDPQNCRRCGRCQVPEILGLAASEEIKMEIVSGGTLARQAVLNHRPEVVVAVACERDLCSGILDSFPLPVYGVVNERPQGPCANTRVDLMLLGNTLNAIKLTRKGADQ